MIIDEMSNEIFTDVEISNRVAAMIESAYPTGNELKIMRRYLANPADVVAKAAFDAYNAEVEAIRAEGRTAKAQAAVMRDALAIERAQARLAQYQLSVGRPQQTLITPTGNMVLDHETGNMVAETVTQIIPEIAPLPATVAHTDTSGLVTQIPNTDITKDDTERLAAQEVVAAASSAVTALIALRYATICAARGVAGGTVV